MTCKMRASSLYIQLIECSKIRHLIQQAKSNHYLSNTYYPDKIWLVFLKYFMIVLYRIDFLEDRCQRIIPKLVCFIKSSICKPKITIVISILNLSIRILACLRILKLNVDLIVFIYNIFYEIFTFFYVFCLFSEFSKHLLVMLSELLHVFLQIFLSHDLLTCVTRNLVLYSIAFTCLQLQEFLLFVQ